ncbi:MAG: mechanosensitive ion channel family protein [Patescibacteria group bacterium]
MFLQIAKAAQTASGTGDAANAGLTEKVAGFFEYMVGQVPSWIAAFIIFVLSIFVAKLAKNAVESRIESQVDEEHQEVMVLAGRVTYFGTLVLGITIALKIAGIDLTTILAAGAFGIGFALQDLIMNFLSGVLILVSRQFTIGDFIKVGNTVGKVMEIQTRATILKAVDGTKVIVPNSEIFTSQVISYTTNPMRRVVVPVYISYDTDIKYAMKIALGVIKKHPKVMKKPKPSIIITNYGNSTIDLAVRFWVGSRDGWFKVKSDIMHEMLEVLDEAGIYAPYNTTHLETEQDTAGWTKEYEERAKKRREEMKLSKAMEESALPAVAAPAPNAAAAATDQPAQVPVMPGAVSQTPPLATAEVPVNPIGEFADQEEIDGQG